MFPPLPDEKFAIIYADPPWNYKGQLQHTGKKRPDKRPDSGGAIRHYPTLTLAALKSLPISAIAEDDCLLFMWSSSPHLDQAIELGRRGDSDGRRSPFVWNKCRCNPGSYTMSENELCIVMKRGRIPQPRGARNIRQTIIQPRTRHSRKPPEARRRIEMMFPYHSRIELFARERVEGWHVWGIDV